MNFTIFRLFLYKWIWGFTASGKYGIYKLIKKHNPNLTDKELSIAIFNKNFESFSNVQERARIKTFFEEYPEPENLLDTCTAIVMVEYNINIYDKKSYKYIQRVLLAKLYKNGYKF